MPDHFIFALEARLRIEGILCLGSSEIRWIYAHLRVNLGDTAFRRLGAAAWISALKAGLGIDCRSRTAYA